MTNRDNNVFIKEVAKQLLPYLLQELNQSSSGEDLEDATPTERKYLNGNNKAYA